MMLSDGVVVSMEVKIKGSGDAMKEGRHVYLWLHLKLRRRSVMFSAFQRETVPYLAVSLKARRPRQRWLYV